MNLHNGSKVESYINAHRLYQRMTQLLERLQKDVASLKRDVRQLQRQLTVRRHASAAQRVVARHDEGEPADDVVAEVEASRRRKREEFVSHEALMKKYGVR